MQFADSVKQVTASAIRDVFEAASDDAINLGLGQPDFSSPEHVRTAAAEAVTAGDADAYTNNPGYRSLRAAIARRYRDDRGLRVDPDEIIATVGATEALYLALKTHVNPGEKVLVPDPGFLAYRQQINLIGATPVSVPRRGDQTVAPEQIAEAIDEDTAAFIINSPNNPTGAVQSRADMEAFAEIAAEEDVLCITDEVYEYFVFDGEHHSPYAFDTENVVLVSAASKTYSMTGWRLGWVIGAQDRIDQMVQVHQFIDTCATAASQHAAEAALSGPQAPVEEMVAAFERRRDIVLDGLDDMGIPYSQPGGAFYVFPEVPGGWVDAVLDADVVVVPGHAFGAHGEGHARISYVRGAEQLKEAIERMHAVTTSQFA